jgi:hypothetical protein
LPLFAVAGAECEDFFAKIFGGLEKSSTFAVPIRKELVRDPRMTTD